LNRDPSGEKGGSNLYAFSQNDGINLIDFLGLKPAKQCKLRGKLASLTFDGLNVAGNGFSTQAVSGVPSTKITGTWELPGFGDFQGGKYGGDIVDYTFDYSVDNQEVPWSGPIPEGEYWVEICKGRHAFSNGEGLPGSWDHILDSESWGKYSWQLHSNSKPYGRKGFYLHGSSEWGSAGCVDLKNGDSKMKRHFDKMKKECGCCYVPFTVKYSVKQNTITDRVKTWGITPPDSTWGSP
jgi:hypothetical protein